MSGPITELKFTTMNKRLIGAPTTTLRIQVSGECAYVTLNESCLEKELACRRNHFGFDESMAEGKVPRNMSVYGGLLEINLYP